MALGIEDFFTIGSVVKGFVRVRSWFDIFRVGMRRASEVDLVVDEEEATSCELLLLEATTCQCSSAIERYNLVCWGS